MATPAQLKTNSGRVIFFLRLLFALFGLVVSTAGVRAAITLEVESMSPVGSGATVSTSNDANASGGVIEFLNATGASQTMTLTTPSVAAGTYQVQFRYKTNTSRGQHTVKIDGVQLGGTIDQYATTSAYVTATLGNVTFSTAATHTILLSVTGKNSSATQYYITADSFTLTLQTAQVATPSFSPVVGTYTSAQTVTITSTTSGVSIRYTTDGVTAPTETVGTLYSGAVPINATTTLKAIAYESGFTDSVVTSGTYTINLPAASAPVFSPVVGTYTSAQTVTITSTTSGASIRYTTDGVTVPTETVGTLYSSAVPINATTTLKAIAYKSGMADSTVTSGLYTISLPTAAAPTFSPVAGTYTSVQTVTITSTTSGASIRYTTDGSAPTETNGTLYSSGVPINATTTLKAIAYASGLADSAVTSGTYTINLPVAATPTFSPIAGTYTSAQTVTIASTTSGALIRYTTDGVTAPTETVGTLYSGAVTISSTTTLKAIAYKAGDTDSTVISGLFTISLPTAAAPTFSPAAGTYTVVKTVTITSTTSSASIRYTTDGVTTPTETVGTLYSGAVTIGSTTTLKAIAYKSGMTDSSVTSGLYTINLPKVATPTFSPAAGTYTSVQSVAITSSTSGATIRYTTDGSMPSETNGTVYSGTKVAINVTTTLKAIAYKVGMADSSVASGTYTLNLPKAATPTFSPGGGTYTVAQSVAISTGTSGATIRYTTDGSTPTETNGTVYSGTKVAINVTTTLKAIAYKVGNADSSVASGTYTINLPAAAAPTFSPVAGTYTGAQSVTITSTTSGASIAYTTDGSTPTENGGSVTHGTLLANGGSVTISATSTLTAIAFETGETDSSATAGNYTINVPAATAPTFSPAAGTYTGAQSVTITSTTSGASIAYTTDGSTPAESGGSVTHGTLLPNGGVVSIGATTTLSAIAFETGYIDSGVTSGTYTINLQPPAAAPTFSPIAGTYTGVQTVTINDTTNGASIRYTTDGSTPTETNGTLYSGPVNLGNTTLLKAMAYESGFADSPTTSGIYTIGSPSVLLNVLYNFMVSSNVGYGPFGGLVQGSDGNFYGTTDAGGGINTSGTVLKITPAGILTVLASFNNVTTNGGSPDTGLVQGSDGNFYGVTYYGGVGGDGTIYKMTPAGALTTLVSFNGTNGATPWAALVQGSDGNFYGTTSGGGSSNDGTVFKMTSAGVLTTLVSFTGANGSSPLYGSLVQGSNGNFYGTTQTGGSNGQGTVFQMTPAGVLTTLVSFVGTNGASPEGGLVQGSDGNFYGTTGGGGSNSDGTVFQMTPVGVLTTLVSFNGANGSSPEASLMQGSDGNFYGTTYGGGSSNNGTVFKVTPTGVLTPLVSFDGANGTTPFGGLVRGSDGNIYGVTEQGGLSDGTIFQLIFPPQIVAPVFSPAAGIYGSAQTVTITSATSGASIRYTTDGSTPTATNGTLYSGPVTISANATLNAFAFEGGLANSTMTSGGYTILASAVAPVFSPAAGTFTSAQMVSITSATSGASIAYTTDGTTPTESGGTVTNGTFYSTAVPIGGTTTLKAIAYGSGFSCSPVTSGIYTINSSNVMCNFTPSNNGGIDPMGGLVQGSDGNFYGTTDEGGSANDGTVFKMTPTGVLTTLVSFSGANGIYPNGGLVQGSDGNFYGTTAEGGSADEGTVFKLTPTGVLTTLVSFSGANGVNPNGGLVQGSDGNFYGTTDEGGSANDGTVFKMTPAGVLTTLVSFNGTNGANPNGGLVQGSDGNFYGTTSITGSGDDGTVFKITPAGALTTLVVFTGANGFNPAAGLVKGSDGNFYGSTEYGGGSGQGTVFKMTPAGVLNTLVSFNGANGAYPDTALVQGSDGNFYGTTDEGGSTDDGIVFELTPAGVLTTLRTFGGADGSNPAGLMQGSDGKFYGTTSSGGTSNDGVIFQLVLPPPTAAPSFSPVAGTYTSIQTVAITSSTNGASIAYTTDGSMPTESSGLVTHGTLYSGPVSIGATTTLTAIAFKINATDSVVTSGVYTITLPVAAAPAFSPVAGTYTSAQTVTITSTTSGASIAYTTDGSTPTESGGSVTHGTLYSGPVSIGVTTTLTAIAYKTGFTDSAPTSGNYTINLPIAAAPTFSPVAGTYTSAQTVTITTATSGASIAYATDGRAPTESGGAITHGVLYGAPVSIGTTTTLMAIAFKAGDADSAVTSGSYTINLPATATPTFSPAAGTYTSVQTVTITSTTSSAKIAYTTDGVMPTETGGVVTRGTSLSNGGTISIGATATLTAIAFKTGDADSAVATGNYILNLPAVAAPAFSPPAGTYTSVQSVTITSTTGGASIAYTTDGSIPTESGGSIIHGTLYSTAMAINAPTTTINAIAFKTGYPDSAVISGTYTINLPPTAAPTFSPVAGFYTGAQTVTITTATSGASINYTTDGSIPTDTNGTLYSGPVNLSSTTLLRAIAYKSGFADSLVTNGIYTIIAPAVLLNVIADSGATWSLVQSTGTYSLAGLVQGSDGNFYGTTPGGGSSNNGTVLKTTPAGVSTTLASFNGGNGAYPNPGLVQGNDGNFYGTTVDGGDAGYGTVFKVTPAGVLTTLASFNFDGVKGINPNGGLIEGSDGNFYGTTAGGGSSTHGTVFEMTPTGVLTTLASFTGANGENPYAGLVQGNDGNFYGTTANGGANNNDGTVFRVTPAGVLTSLFSFDGGADGSTPYAALMQASDGNFYGTTSEGGSGNVGTIFKMTPAGVLTPLISFDGANGDNPFNFTQGNDGNLVQGNDGNLYGTAEGPAPSYGVFFQLILSQAAAPVFSPSAGDYTSAQMVTITSATSGASIAYTTDGSTPTEVGGTVTNGTLYSSPLPISAATTLKAMAFKTALTDSTVASGNYTFLPPVAAPAFSPSAGTYTTTKTVTIISATSGASIAYTTDGSIPTESGGTVTNGTLYSTPLTINASTILTAMAFETGAADSVVTKAIYVITPLPAPAFSLPGGTYTSDQVVAITSATSGASIAYTTDGSYPAESDGTVTNGTLYSNPLAINNGTMLQAIAFKAGYADSAVTSAIYTVNPVNVLYNFSSADNGGIGPQAGLVQGNDGNFYGTTISGGGSKNGGTIFRMTPAGVVTTLVVFNGTNGGYANAALVQGIDGNFYGATYNGGSAKDGTVFKMTPAGVLTTLVSFIGANGANPQAALVQGNDGNFYGTTTIGGTVTGTGSGTVFKMTPAGVLTTLVSFNGTTNGSSPEAALVQGSDGNFYGTTFGYNGNVNASNTLGTIFKMTPAGVLTTLVSFNGTNGANPEAALVQGSDGNFYGTTSSGGSNGGGTVFEITPTGVLTTLVSFDVANGYDPEAALVQGSDGNFYGTTKLGGDSSVGGSSGDGTVFRITPAGALTTLVSFDGTNGTGPNSLVQGSNGKFYGTTYSGGVSNSGVIFQLSISPAAAPVFSPAGGTYTNIQTVTITSATVGAAISYTTNGSTPTETNGTLYSGPVTISANTTLKAIAFGTDWTDSAVASGAYIINLPVAAAPAFGPAAGTYANEQTVTITSATSGALIAYTTDGTMPAEANGSITNGILYSNPVAITTAAATLNAIAFKTGYLDSAMTSGSYTITNPPPQTPVFNPAGGIYTGAQSVAITSAGATSIYYTTDGSTPTISSTRYTGAVPIGGSTVLQAVGVNSGGSSPVASASFTLVAPAPVFSLAPGTYANATTLSVAISDAAGATIYYTTDGTTPNTSSTQYTAAVPLPLGTTTISAIAVNVLGTSSVTSGTYVLTPPPPLAPVFNPAGGTYTSLQRVIISSVGATAVYYTTDGTTPTTASTLYTWSVPISSNTVLQAIGVNNGGPSPVASASFTFLLPAPVFSPAPGTYTSATTPSVTISDANGATIYYTTDGTTPTASSTPYTAAVSLPVGSTTLNAIAIESGFPASAITGGTYTIITAPVAAAPVFSPAAGSVPGAPVVAITSATSGASIRYTTDGVTPPTETVGTLYSGPVSITAPTKFRAIAFATGYTDSLVTNANIGMPTISIINP